MNRRSLLSFLGLAAAAPMALRTTLTDKKPTFAEREAAIRAEEERYFGPDDTGAVEQNAEIPEEFNRGTPAFGTIRSRDGKMVIDITNKRITIG